MSASARSRIAIFLLIATAFAFSPRVALAARAWTLSSSPQGATAGDPVAVTLTARNTGGDGGGDEITCISIDIPTAFSIQSVAIVSIKGASTGHGWQYLTSNGSGVVRVTFKNPADNNPLVGLPSAGDSAVFRVTGTASSSGTMTWRGGAADKPGSATSTNCGSGTFATETVTLDVSPPPTPTPKPTPAPTPAPTATPRPTPSPTPTPHATPRPTSSPSFPTTPTQSPKPGQDPTASPRPTLASGEPSSPGDSAEPTFALEPSALPTASASSEVSADPSASPPAAIGGATDTPRGSGGPSGVDHVIDANAATIGGNEGTDASRLGIGGLESSVMDIVARLDLATWSVPAAAVGVPGMLVLLVVLFQMVGGVAWVPVARRSLAGVGVRRSTTPFTREEQEAPR